MKSLIFLFTLFNYTFLNSQIQEQKESSFDYLNYIGDIEANQEVDNPNFSLCKNEGYIYQYFNFGEGPVYEGEKSSILNTFHSKYKVVNKENNNGYVRIRFIVNCEGNPGRYRVLQSDLNYKENSLNPKIINQLLKITKSIKRWPILVKNEEPLDYYMYLLFKLENGKITEILP